MRLHLVNILTQNFVGIIIDISERELSLIEDSGLFDSNHLAKLYTYANLEFDIQDRVALDEEYFEIIKLDYSLGYKTLILRRIVMDIELEIGWFDLRANVARMHELGSDKMPTRSHLHK
ncbi:DUF1506 family protein [Borrelia miyamotoi]|uniref:DUF1506 family protein n=1 Tax=Borrelia miyamotoi TaxID=47466 RepID=UPI001E58C7FF|nr:DUF1506 family protein [Borrelia miyamotoi]